MTKEAFGGEVCVCGRKFAYPTYHWPHCHFNPINMAAVAKAFPGGAHDTILAKFSKSELAKISTHGPVRDEKVGKRGKQRKMGVSGKRQQMKKHA